MHENGTNTLMNSEGGEHLPTEKLSEILARIFSPDSKKLSYGELVNELDHHGMAIVLILFSIPAALPVPAAGYSTLLSLPLLSMGIRLLMGHETIWLPEKVRAWNFNPADFSKGASWMRRITLFIERFTRPRAIYLCCGGIARFWLGLLVCLLAFSMALPIPGTNTLPAGGVFLIGFGMLENDGIMTMLGVLYSILAVAVSCAVIYFGYEVVKHFASNLI